MVKIVVGMMGSSAASGSTALSSTTQLQGFLSACQKFGVTELDTARGYNSGRSEELLGQVEAGQRFVVATKAPAFSPGSLSYDNIIANCSKSLSALKLDCIPLYYLHGPDAQTPYQEQCRAIGALHKDGRFDKWGVSNISSDDVAEIISICQTEGYPIPSVYQGGYNPVNRALETSLFPLLRKHGMRFYAYSPLAGGLLAKPMDEIKTPAKGSRYDAMPVFGKIYLTDKVVKSLEQLTAQCQSINVSVMEATLRWLLHHSPLQDNDALILGASSTLQIEASLAATQHGPLDRDTVERFEAMWTNINNSS